MKQQQRPVSYSFLSYDNTMSYTDHLSASSNQSQSRQIMHEEVLSATFVEHVQATEVSVPRW
ncbi:unnamed protein product [Schistosoma mattheei]|uniref:Uncharacterized protein n=1 Tax=Schistosoma mattheei TaxID=31246 RepID=A0A3P8DUJ3_9TREM|nr:unnamed protein product [Schistosoma mattheei]